ncbi:MAG TPA: HEAT repeat domain-containing protein [Candidatus Polarisedimenticolia bacterium]|jgi:HEAT repeat protein
MNETLSRICALLGSQKSEHQMAAALVLAELEAKEPAVVRALSAALATGSRPLRILILETLARVASPLAVPDLLPLIEAADEEIRDRATKALIAIGPAAIKPIAVQVLDATPAARRALIAVLSRVKRADSVQTLVTLAGSGHPEAAREAAGALVTLSHTMSRPEQVRLRGMIEKILKAPPDKAPSGSLSAGLQVMAGVGQASYAQALLRLTGGKYAETVRRDALLAISGVLKGGPLPTGVLAGILPIITEGPSPALRSAALEVLGTIKLPRSSLEALLKLLDHRDPAVRRFAARRLSGDGLGGLKACRRLIALLADADPSLRDAASDSLGKMPEAGPLLMDELARCQEVHRGWTIAHILKHHVGRLRRPAVRALFDKAVKALVRDERVWEPYLYVVRHHDPKQVYEWLMEEAARFKKVRKYSEAEACLRPLTSGEHFDSEARFALALAGIKAARTRGAGVSRGGGNPLDLFRQLVRDPSFPLLERLKKERAHLETQDLYYLGFSLAEGPPAEKEVGGELLKLVAARAGASKLGRSARNKLRSEGLAL